MAKDFDKFFHRFYRATFDQENMLGKGSYGKVYKAYSKFNNEPRAVKVISKVKRNGVRMNSVDFDNIDHEIKKLIELDHENITKYFSCFEDKDKIYIVMEIALDGTLR